MIAYAQMGKYKENKYVCWGFYVEPRHLSALDDIVYTLKKKGIKKGRSDLLREALDDLLKKHGIKAEPEKQ